MPTHQCTPAAHPELPVPAGGWPLPGINDVVQYRSECDLPTVTVTVVAVDAGDLDDFNVWTRDEEGLLLRDEEGQPVMLPAPNPNVTLLLASGSLVVTRQIRYAGSPGWEV